MKWPHGGLSSLGLVLSVRKSKIQVVTSILFDGLGYRNHSRYSPLPVRVLPSASFGRNSCVS
jgi:hypothetical protein